MLELVLLTSMVAGMALPLASASPFIAYGAWIALWFVLAAHDEQLRHAENQDPHHGFLIFPTFPVVFVVQHVLDRCVPWLGSALVLFGGLAMIRAFAGRCSFPTARVVR